MNRAPALVIPTSNTLPPSLSLGDVEGGPGDGPQPHHSRAKTPAVEVPRCLSSMAGVLARDTWPYPGGSGPSGGEEHQIPFIR